jgi:hypothetical protein
MLPIYLKDRDFSPPADRIYYLLTRDGLFLVKKTPFFEAVVPASGIPWLEAQEGELRLLSPPLPAALLLEAVSFFRAVYARFKSEALVLLGWREATGAYELVIPHQKVGGMHLDYEVREFPSGLTRIGTIHSHAGAEAFHSERDNHDERFEDGFHITVGNISEEAFQLDVGEIVEELTLSCSLVVQGYRGYLHPGRLFSPYPIPWEECPGEDAWAREVAAKVTPLPWPIEFGP